MSNQTIALYSQNAFDVANPNAQRLKTMLAEARAIGTSGFTVMILGQWHVMPNGTVSYNRTPYQQVAGHLPEIIKALKAGGGLQKVLVTFGPFQADFDHMNANQPAVKQVMSELKAAGVDGFDWDLEGGWGSEQTQTLIDFTQWVNDQGLIVTAAPYNQQSFWTNLLQALSGTPGFAWWNLQTYGGASYDAWVDLLQNLVPSPESFLVPGYSANYSSPQAVQQALSAEKGGHSGLSGGFIWNSSTAQSNGNTLPSYAQAIEAGIS